MQALLALPGTERVDPAPVAFTMSNLGRGAGNDGQTIQVQQALCQGWRAVAVAVAVPASSASSVTVSYTHLTLPTIYSV